MTSRSPESAASTLACAVRSTELNGTPSSSATRRNVATGSSGILASFSPTPGTGPRVHRGSAVNPPARRTPRQNSRPRSAVVTVPRRPMLLISHLLGGVPTPPRVCWDPLSLHPEGVCCEHGAVTHGHAVEDECTDPERAAGANRGSVAFERAVLLRVALDLAPAVENRLVPDRGERRVGDVGAVVEDPPADPHTHQPPEHVLERRAVERVEIVNRIHLKPALGRPEIRVVDGTDCRPHGMQRLDAAVDQGEVDRGDHDAEREEHGTDDMRHYVVQLDGSEVEQCEQKNAHPAGEEEQADGSKVVAVLGRKAAAQGLPRPEMVEL